MVVMFLQVLWRDGEHRTRNSVEPWSGGNCIWYGDAGHDSMLGVLLDGPGCGDNDADMKYRPSSRRETKHDADEGLNRDFAL